MSETRNENLTESSTFNKSPESVDESDEFLKNQQQLVQKKVAETLLNRKESLYNHQLSRMSYEELKALDRHEADDGWNILMRDAVFREAASKLSPDQLQELKDEMNDYWEENVHPNVCTKSAEKMAERMEEELKKAVSSMSYEELQKYDQHGSNDAWNILMGKSGAFGQKLQAFGDPVLTEMKERAQEDWEESVHPNVCTKSAEKMAERMEEELKKAVSSMSYEELQKYDQHGPNDAWNILMAKSGAFGQKLQAFGDPVLTEMKERSREEWEENVHPNVCIKSAEKMAERMEEELKKAVSSMSYEELQKYDQHGPNDAWNILMAKSGAFGQKLQAFGDPVLTEMKERAQEDWEENVHPNVCTKSAEKMAERMEEELKKAVSSMSYEELQKYDQHGPNDAWNILMAKSGVFGQKLQAFGDPVLTEMKDRAQEEWEENVHPNVCTKSAEKMAERMEEELKKAVSSMSYEELQKYDQHGPNDAWNILMAKSGVFGQKLKAFGEPVLTEMKDRAQEEWEENVHPNVCTKSAEKMAERMEEELKKAVSSMSYEELQKYDQHGPNDAWNILMAKSGVFGQKLQAFGDPVLTEMKERSQEEWEENVHPNVCTKSAEKMAERMEEELKKAVSSMSYEELQKYDQHGPNDAWNILMAKSGVFGQKLQAFGDPVLTEMKERSQEEWEENVHPNVCTKSAEKMAERMEEELKKAVSSMSYEELQKYDQHGPNDAWNILMAKSGVFGQKLQAFGDPVLTEMKDRAQEEWEENVHPNVCTKSAEKDKKRLPGEFKSIISNLPPKELKALKADSGEGMGLLKKYGGIFAKKITSYGEPVITEMNFAIETLWSNDVYPQVDRSLSALFAESQKKGLAFYSAVVFDTKEDLLTQSDFTFKKLVKSSDFQSFLNEQKELLREGDYQKLLDFMEKSAENELQARWRAEKEKAHKEYFKETQAKVPKLLDGLVFSREMLSVQDFSPKAIMNKKDVEAFLAEHDQFLTDDQKKELRQILAAQVQQLEGRWKKEQQSAIKAEIKSNKNSLDAALQFSAEDIKNERYHGPAGQKNFEEDFLKRAHAVFPAAYLANSYFLTELNAQLSQQLSKRYKEWHELHEQHHQKENLENYDSLRDRVRSVKFDKKSIERKKELWDSPEKFRQFFIEEYLGNDAETLKELQDEAPELYSELMLQISGTPYETWKKEYVRIENERLAQFKKDALAAWKQKSISAEDPKYLNNPQLYVQERMAQLPKELAEDLLENDQEVDFVAFKAKYLKDEHSECMTAHQEYRKETLQKSQSVVQEGAKALQAKDFAEEDLTDLKSFMSSAKVNRLLNDSQKGVPDFLIDELSEYQKQVLEKRYYQLLKVDSLKDPSKKLSPEKGQKPQYISMLQNRSFAFQSLEKIDSTAFAAFVGHWGEELGAQHFDDFLHVTTTTQMSTLDFLQALFVEGPRLRVSMEIRKNSPQLWNQFKNALQKSGFSLEDLFSSQEKESLLEDLEEEDQDDFVAYSAPNADLLDEEIDEIEDEEEEEEDQDESNQEAHQIHQKSTQTALQQNASSDQKDSSTDDVVFEEQKNESRVHIEDSPVQVQHIDQFAAQSDTYRENGFDAQESGFEDVLQTGLDTNPHFLNQLDQSDFLQNQYDGNHQEETSLPVSDAAPEMILDGESETVLNMYDAFNSSQQIVDEATLEQLENAQQLEEGFESVHEFQEQNDSELFDQVEDEDFSAELFTGFGIEQSYLFLEDADQDPSVQDVFVIEQQIQELQQIQKALLHMQAPMAELEWIIRELSELLTLDIMDCVFDQEKWQQLQALRAKWKQQWWRRFGVRLNTHQDFEQFFDRFKGHLTLRQLLQMFVHYVRLTQNDATKIRSQIPSLLLKRLLKDPRGLFWKMVKNVTDVYKKEGSLVVSLQAHQPISNNNQEYVCVQLEVQTDQKSFVNHHESLMLPEADDVQSVILKSFQDYFSAAKISDSKRMYQKMEEDFSSEGLKECWCGIRTCVHQLMKK